MDNWSNLEAQKQNEKTPATKLKVMEDCDLNDRTEDCNYEKTQ